MVHKLRRGLQLLAHRRALLGMEAGVEHEGALSPFEPAGMTDDPDIRFATSLID